MFFQLMESRGIVTLMILVGLAAVNSAPKGTCPAKYSRFSAKHSFCLDANPKCTILKEGVDKKERNFILRLHNKLRSRVATGREQRAGGLPPASNMLQMEWDHELASIAQKWALQCDFNHDCPNCRTVERFQVGQNLGIEMLGCSSDDCIEDAVIPNWEANIRNFYREVKYFNKDYINPLQHNSTYGHFIQIAWAKTWKIGCGYVAFKDGVIKRLYVCNYGPPVIKGMPLYKPGETCSDCPSNTCCTCRVQGPTYPGLCKVRNLSLGPVYEKSRDAVLDRKWRDESSPRGMKEHGV